MRVFTKYAILLSGLFLVNSMGFSQSKSGTDPAGLAPASNLPNVTFDNGIIRLPNDSALAYNAFDPSGTYPQGPVTFFLNSPSTMVSISDQTGENFLAGASWANGLWYAAVYDTISSPFVTIDPVTGIRSTIGLMGMKATDIAYDWTTNKMYALGYSGANTILYTVNLTTGHATAKGLCGAWLGIGLACSYDGKLFAVDINNDRLMYINKNNGVSTVVGPIGFDASYAQTIEYDNSGYTLYFAAYNATTNAGELRTINTITGATTLVDYFPGGMEVTGLAIRNNGLATSVNQGNSQNQFTFYPNPAHQQITITSEFPETARFTMLNLLGQVMMESNIDHGNKTLNISNINPGLYIMQIESKQGKFTRKIEIY